MKLFQKKKNNKGFSLVELIVVVAIMAVLMAILIPTLIRYVEKTKFQKDISAIEEIRTQMENALAADEKFSGLNGSLAFTNCSSITISNSTTLTGGTKTTDSAKYFAEVTKDINGEDATTYTYDLTSKLAGTGTTVTFTIANEKVTYTITVATGNQYANDEKLTSANQTATTAAAATSSDD